LAALVALWPSAICDPYGPSDAMPARLLGQLLGNALLEETFFRGYLFSRLSIMLLRRRSPALSLGLAATLSTTLFALAHLPRMLYEGPVSQGDILGVTCWAFAFGLLLTGVFITSGNVFLAVALHALWNAPTMIIAVHPRAIECSWWTLTGLFVAAMAIRNARRRSLSFP